MDLTSQDVERLARLARIALAPGQIERTRAELQPIFGLIDKLQAADTTGVEPLTHPQSSRMKLRPDEVTEQVDRDAFQALAPEVERGLYLVPRVVE